MVIKKKKRFFLIALIVFVAGIILIYIQDFQTKLYGFILAGMGLVLFAIGIGESLRDWVGMQ